MKTFLCMFFMFTIVSAYQDALTHRTKRNRPGELDFPYQVPDGYDDDQMKAWLLEGNSPEKDAVHPQPNKPLRLAVLATRWRTAVIVMSSVLGWLVVGSIYHACRP